MLRQTALVALSLLPGAFAQISDNFEEGFSTTTWPTYAPDCNQGGSVTLDTTKGHSGTNSVKVTGGSSGYCGHIFFGTTQVPTGGNVYVRVWVQALTALGSEHATFITMPDATQSGKHLRMGGQDQVMAYNRESDDATLPDMSPQGVATSVALPTGTWECLEYYLSSNGTIQTWLNGAAIAGMTVGPGISNPNSNGWGSSYKPSITGVYFGWEDYSGDVNTFWYDDILIGSTRSGCSATSGTSPSGGSPPPPPPASSSSTSSSAAVAPTTTTSSAAAPTTLATTTTTSKAAVPTTSKTTTTTTTSKASGSTGTAQLYAQCGGIGFNGPTACASPAACVSSNPYYSQCLDQ